MKATIRDFDAIGVIRPVDVTVYLRQAGWTEQEQARSRAIWTREDFEVLVPLNSTFRDYSVRMAELLQTLSVAEDRSELELFEDLTTSGADVIRLRLIDSEVEAGSVPLEEAALMGTRARELMFSAACAANFPKAVYGPRRPENAIEYVRGVRMGQTEHGSFVLKLLSPVPPRLRHESPEKTQLELAGVPPAPDEEPFARKVTLQLATAIRATHEAAICSAGSGSITAFEKAVSLGVSANLCDAITGLASPADPNRQLEISIAWALSRPVEETSPPRVLFAPDMFPIIAEASRMFRGSAPRDDFEVYGPIIQLERSENSDTGQITVHALVEERPRKISITLDVLEYEKAVDAHKSHQTIRCSGVLIKEGKSYKLRNPSSVEVESDE